jgi:hypothetical protein
MAKLKPSLAQSNAAKTAQSGKGRPRNKLYLLADGLLVLAVVGTLAYMFVDRQQKASLEADVCRAPARNHQVTIQGDAFSQKTLAVNLCDTISITNKDTQLYQLNFGTHDQHISYPGFQSLVQAKDETINIDALQQGTFRLHDHIRDKAVLSINVGPKE